MRIIAIAFLTLIGAFLAARTATAGNGIDTSGVQNLPFSIQGNQIMNMTTSGLAVGATASNVQLTTNGNVIAGGNMSATGTVTATGNVTGANLVVSGASSTPINQAGAATVYDLATLPVCGEGQAIWGQRGIFPKEHAKGVSAIGHGFPLPKPLIFSFGGLGSRLAEQVARDVDQREPPPFFGQFGGVGLDEYLDGLVAGINFDTQRAALEIDFVTPSRFTANNCMGHLRSYERLKG